jgi:hypothetical protein
MPKFIIKASEEHIYECEIEAKDQDEAQKKFCEGLTEGTIEPLNVGGTFMDIDEVYEEE